MENLENLPVDWYSIPEVSDYLQIPQREVRTMLKQHELIAVRGGDNFALRIPAQVLIFPTDGVPQIVAGLSGTLTLLSDLGFTDEEQVQWLISDNLELGMSPLAALQAGQLHAVRRAALTA
ncbi:MAG: helix-turn-helix domain-containing protein [Arcanobacterium sp.]|nr:helix-turn-helix domain-containing protein [Arcanobacterium sp.]